MRGPIRSGQGLGHGRPGSSKAATTRIGCWWRDLWTIRQLVGLRNNAFRLVRSTTCGVTGGCSSGLTVLTVTPKGWHHAVGHAAGSWSDLWILVWPFETEGRAGSNDTRPFCPMSTDQSLGAVVPPWRTDASIGPLLVSLGRLPTATSERAQHSLSSSEKHGVPSDLSPLRVRPLKSVLPPP